MAKIDYEYHITAAQVRRYQQVPLVDRLRWLEDLCVFTKLVRRAPTNRRVARLPAGTKTRKRANPPR